MKKLLFITHEASRTGAPFVLLFFLQWLQRERPEIEISVLALKDGGLEDDLKKVSHYYYTLSNYKQSQPKSIVYKVLKKIGFTTPITNKVTLINELVSKKFDIIYSNTILAIPIGHEIVIRSKQTKHFVHVHELNSIIKLLLPNLKKYVTHITHFIAASNLVKRNLISNWNIPAKQISRVYECAQINHSFLKRSSEGNAFHIGGSGTVHWRKGSDLFIQVARYINTRYPEKKIKYTWVGGISEKEKIIMEEDLRKMKLEHVVSFVGQQQNPELYYNNFDLFLMTSREDPFPLVCIELGQLGKPIICFEGATGSEEIIKQGGGFCVPYMDIEAMAEQVVFYMNHPEVRAEHGKLNSKQFSKFSPDQICPQLFSVLMQKSQI